MYKINIKEYRNDEKVKVKIKGKGKGKSGPVCPRLLQEG
jgi:hypothetical protein